MHFGCSVNRVEARERLWFASLYRDVMHTNIQNQAGSSTHTLTGVFGSSIGALHIVQTAQCQAAK